MITKTKNELKIVFVYFMFLLAACTMRPKNNPSGPQDSSGTLSDELRRSGIIIRPGDFTLTSATRNNILMSRTQEITQLGEEHKGFGLYTYIFAKEAGGPNSELLSRYNSLISVIKSTYPTPGPRDGDPSKVNLFIIPSAEIQEQWMKDFSGLNYDLLYANERRRPLGSGPYLITFMQPISEIIGMPGASNIEDEVLVLILDLTRVNISAQKDFVNCYVNQLKVLDGTPQGVSCLRGQITRHLHGYQDALGVAAKTVKNVTTFFKEVIQGL